MDLSKNPKKIAKDILDIKIQGARNVALAGVEMLLIYAKKVRNLKKLKQKMEEIKDLRPTEPMLRYYVNSTYDLIRSEKDYSEENLRNIGDKILKEMAEKKRLITEFGSNMIEEGSRVITYCHSSTVTGILIYAKKKKKKNFEVVACETRPKYQGRITAKELVENGLDVTLTTDMGVSRYLKKADLVIVGADAITSQGSLVNKIGTASLARLASLFDVPFYSAAELAKYDPVTRTGWKERIELRSSSEVWEKAPKKLKIDNYAFDLTESKYISAFITEKGVFKPAILPLIYRNSADGIPPG